MFSVWKLLFLKISKNRGSIGRAIILLFVFFTLFLLFRNKIDVSYNLTNFHDEEPNFETLKYADLFKKLNPVINEWGQNGQPVTLTDKQKAIADPLFKSAAFNVYISDRLSPNRSLPDPRPYECAKLVYDLKNLGQVSIIIIFTNEVWSALTRTIWSVVNRSPKILLKEIILVDDFSDKFELGEPLEEYVKYYFKDLVKILRSQKREGLIRARLLGAKKATGDVLLFLDSHCEATEGWLEPMMKVIKDDRTSVVCPVIDVISDKTLEYQRGSRYFFQIGGFTWSGHFTWIDTDADKLEVNPTEIVKTPTMAGGLFAVNREYFFEIGSYDEKMEIWGGENLELSFRVWQCGGKMYIHPCSRVGHIFRDFHPYSFLGKDSHGINTLRTVLVWMDEYSRYFFMHRNDLKEKIDSVDVSERIELKKQLKCKSFRWYLENVYTEKKFIYDQDVFAYGSIRNPITNLCLDNLNREEDSKHPIGVYQCINADLDDWTNQMFSYMKDGQIRREEGCLTIDRMATHRVLLDKCQNGNSRQKSKKNKQKNQIWTHTKGGQIKNEYYDLCLSTEGLKTNQDLRVLECNKDDLYQIWWFQKYTDIQI